MLKIQSKYNNTIKDFRIMEILMKRRNILSLSTALLIQPYYKGITTANAASGRILYVSNSGNDENDGTMMSKPLRSATAASRKAASGDSILFQCGGSWSESFVVRAPGLLLGSYGSGSLPILSGANRLDSKLTRTSNSQVWRVSLNLEPTQVFVNDMRGRRRKSAKECTSHRDWCWINGMLTVCGKSDNGLPRVDASVRDVVIDANGYPGLRIERLQIERARRHCVVLGPSNAPVIRNCEIIEGFQNGIEFGTVTRHDHGLIEANLLREHGQTGINGGGRMAGWVIRNNTIRSCGRIHDEVLGGTPSHRWTAGIKIWGWATSQIQGGLLIEGNIVSDCYPHAWALEHSQPHNLGCGIWIDEVFNPTDMQILRNNRVTNCQSRGIFIEKSDRCIVSNNIIKECGMAMYTGGFSMQGNGGRGASENTVEYNTVQGGWWAAEIGGNEVTNFNNNVIRNNIFYGSPNQQLYVVGGGANVVGKGNGNAYYGNCLDVERPNFLIWQDLYGTLAEFEAAAAGQAYKNIAKDPLFAFGTGFSLSPGSPCFGTAIGGGNIGAWQG